MSIQSVGHTQKLWAYAERIKQRMEKMSEEDRLEVLRILRRAYCIHCGGNGGWQCQCINDE